MGHECSEPFFEENQKMWSLERLRIQLVSSTLGIENEEDDDDDDSGKMVVGDDKVDGEYDETKDYNHQWCDDYNVNDDDWVEEWELP